MIIVFRGANSHQSDSNNLDLKTFPWGAHAPGPPIDGCSNCKLKLDLYNYVKTDMIESTAPPQQPHNWGTIFLDTLYDSISKGTLPFHYPLSSGICSPVGRYIDTVFSRKVGASNVFIAYIANNAPILHLGKVLYLRYRMFPCGHSSW